MGQKAAISIYLVLIVLIGVLMIAMAISSFMLLQQKMAIETGLSNKAYQAADSGMEWALRGAKEGKDISGLREELLNEGHIGVAEGTDWLCSGENPYWIKMDSCSYCLYLEENGDITPKIVKFKSIGKCGNVRRAIEVEY